MIGAGENLSQVFVYCPVFCRIVVKLADPVRVAAIRYVRHDLIGYQPRRERHKPGSGECIEGGGDHGDEQLMWVQW